MKKLDLTLKLFVVILFSNASFGQIFYPGGDSCSYAIPIPIGETYNTPDDGPGSEHWYSFIAPCDGELVVSHAGDNESEKRILSGICSSLDTLAFGSWVTSDISTSLLAGQSVYIQITDTWDNTAQFNVQFSGCDEIDSALLDLQGHVYYDLNNNGVRDGGENGKFLTPIISDPDGIFCVSGLDGHYYQSVADIEDGVYEIYPVLDEYWGVSSDSSSYTIVIDDSFEQLDSLDFGLHPDTLIHEVAIDLTGSFPRCNDTINYYLSVFNNGTTVASGSIHFEIDDSLHYVSADMVPDSIVGQNLYWSYENLSFYQYQNITVQLGTPDGVEDTVTNTLAVTIDSAGVEMFSSSETATQLITCAYDPNDKTPNPLGEGEFGYILPTTESIEYLVRFQNTGTDTAFNVVIKDQLDENLDWYSITPISFSHYMVLEMDINGEVSFIFNNIFLPDSNVNELASHGFVKYRVDLKPDLPLETSIFNTAHIYFDLNPAVITNTAVNTLHIDNTGIDELMKNQELLVYPNPFNESTTVYFGKDLANYSIKIVDLLGKQIYYNNELSGNKLEIQNEKFKQGMYILLLVDNELNQTVSTAKLMVK